MPRAMTRSLLASHSPALVLMLPATHGSPHQGVLACPAHSPDYGVFQAHQAVVSRPPETHELPRPFVSWTEEHQRDCCAFQRCWAVNSKPNGNDRLPHPPAPFGEARSQDCFGPLHCPAGISTTFCNWAAASSRRPISEKAKPRLLRAVTLSGSSSSALWQ